MALGGPAGDIARPAAGAWRGLGLTEAQHRRMVDYLAGVLWALDAGRLGDSGPAGLLGRGRLVTAALAASWSATMRYAREAADHFWCAVEDHCPGTLPERRQRCSSPRSDGWSAVATTRPGGRRCWLCSAAPAAATGWCRTYSPSRPRSSPRCPGR
ncbi:hypothetical protein V2I01_02435 [Micromonospora sp. BRA006-A]|nr:hypothetical protein [Micromonospora sp. BRA006-A]